MLITIIIELLVAKKMKITNYNTIIKVNIFTQVLFHLVFLIPQTYLGISLVTIIGVVIYKIVGYVWAELIILILPVVIIELLIVVIEFLLYKKFINYESKKRLFKYSFLANLASFALSVIVWVISMIF